MADRPMASTSTAGRPRMRSRSVHLPTCIPVASKAAKPRARSVYKAQVKGKSDEKKSGKTTIVISSDSEESSGEVDFPHFPTNQPVNLPAEEPEEPNQPLDIPAEGPEEPDQPNNPNPLPENLPVPMANNHLNWSHCKLDFSGKPEEDTEAHLLRTNDWMTTHDFPDDQKVRRFCLTLSGEARLWYETLGTQQQLDWAGLQECFRQQYSKFGNTREQYFHAWRSFQFDEAADTIDGYIQKVKQVAALLNYGEPQTLELFKNTLLSRLYYMLYQINDLKVVVETAKRLLTKVKMDKKSGQATSSPFMQTCQGNSKSKCKAEKNEKKVVFSAVEAIERTTDNIERPASLMDKMDTKLGRREDQYRPRIYQGRDRGHSFRQNNYRSRNRSYSRDQYQNNYRGRGNYNRGGNRNYRSNYRDSSRS